MELGRRAEIIKTLCVCMWVFFNSEMNTSLLLFFPYYPEPVLSAAIKNLFCLSYR